MVFPVWSGLLSLVMVFLSFPFFGSASELSLDSISLPPGFSIHVYADHVENARSMARSPRGTLFVGTRKAGKVYALVDRDKDMRVDEVHVIADGLNMPNGVAFREGALYVAEVSRLLRFDGIDDRVADPPDAVVVLDDYPRDRHHGWKFIRFGPDGLLYVPVGAPCNVCEREDPYASLTRVRVLGTDPAREVFARGIRNTVGFDWHSGTGELWFADNGRDWLGDDLPPDELNRATAPGMHFGFPGCFGRSGQDPEFGVPGGCEGATPAEVELPAHVAPLGVRFYHGDMFPSEYQGRIFIAEHGSWNRSEPQGYRVTTVNPSAVDIQTSYQVFAEGWLHRGKAWGRPVDLEILPDGSLLVSDDKAGAIYRITYTGSP